MIQLTPIGYIRSARREPVDDNWDAVECHFELAPEIDAEALRGIEEFSHVELVFQFHLVPESGVERGARHPRGNPDFPRVGIFAQRGKQRPNRLGVSVARLVHKEDRVLTLRGLDALDGSPVLDLKPVLHEFLPRGVIEQPAWTRVVMRNYWEPSA